MRLTIIILLSALHQSTASRDRLDISRFPHIEEFEDNVKQRSGFIDVSTYMESLEEPRISEHLTDLPDELQQLQQQLLEVCQLLILNTVEDLNATSKSESIRKNDCVKY